MVSKKFKGLVGLGNLGSEYEQTNHNIGVAAQAYFQKELEQKLGQPLHYFKVCGYMNQSGVAVRNFIRNHNLELEEVLVIHDDSDLYRGDYKVVFGGGSGGHLGVQSILDHLQSPAFWRLKIGIRDPEEVDRKKAIAFVLQKISPEQQEVFQTVFAKALEDILTKI